MKIKKGKTILFYDYLQDHNTKPNKGKIVNIIDDSVVVRWDKREIESFCFKEDIVKVIK